MSKYNNVVVITYWQRESSDLLHDVWEASGWATNQHEVIITNHNDETYYDWYYDLVGIADKELAGMVSEKITKPCLEAATV